uniref:Carboxylic ester hydrolase n=1 Tax=Panagrellus redivivus TaxID=6233 RepID=A0A7E4VKL5_PANRE
MFIAGHYRLLVYTVIFGLLSAISAHFVPPKLWKFPLLSRVNEDELLVRGVSPGKLKGASITTPKNTSAYAFFAIPIAEPTTGKNRFRAPIPRKPWSGILDASKPGVSCYWNTSDTSNVPSDFEMDEDCIYVNVYTNKHCLQKGGCAVVYYIHGGALKYGTTLQYDPMHLIDNFNNASRNVIFVNINFRQALFAVLNLNYKLDLPIDLNAGFHDIVHGLRWVKKEIHNFGGDPDRITVMGHSAGAIFAQMLTLSPQSKYLFNRAIVMSSVDTDCGFVPDRNQHASRLASTILNCSVVGIKSRIWNNPTYVIGVIECLRNKSALEVSMAQKALDGSGALLGYLAQDFGDNALFPGGFKKLYAETPPMTVLSGTLSKEYLHSRDIVYHPNRTKQLWAINETRLEEYAEKSLNVYGAPDAKRSVVERVMKEYHSVPRAIYLYDDVANFVPMRNFAAHVTSQGGHSYLYEFTYTNIGNAYVRGLQQPQFTVAESPHHGQDLAYLVGQHVGNFTSKDHKIQYLYSQVFVNFINHGTPENKNQSWHKFNPKKDNFFVIDFPDPDLAMPGENDGYHRDAVRFWNDEIPRLTGPPKPPKTESDIGLKLQLQRLSSSNANDLPIFMIAIPPVPSNRTNEESIFGWHNDDDYDDEADGLYEPPKQDTGHDGINWVITTWIGIGIIVLLAISHAVTCMKLRSKRNDYQYI